MLQGADLVPFFHWNTASYHTDLLLLLSYWFW